ncbi:excinuclease UvrABC ATPase subunit [Bradyrhizobium elkanii]|jgi:hypothetical protein
MIEPQEIRIFPCGACGGDGGHHDFAGHWFRCMPCKGEGWIEVELQPVEMEDLDQDCIGRRAL